MCGIQVQSLSQVYSQSPLRQNRLIYALEVSGRNMWVDLGKSTRPIAPNLKVCEPYN